MLIRLAFSGEPPPEANIKEQEVKNNSSLSTLNSQLIEKVSVQLNADRLKLIDELSRLISELKKQFPELAQNLEKARDYVSASQDENIPVKKLLNLLASIRQNINIDNSLVKNLAEEAIKILQPKQSAEAPPENKLILVLSKNDFESANTIIKNIAAAPLQAPARAESFQPQQTPQTFQAILNALQEFKELGIPKELQNAPLKELEAMILQKTGIEVPKDLVKSLSMAFGEKPVFAELMIAPVTQKEQPQQLQQPQQSQQSQQPLQSQSPQSPPPQPSQTVVQTYEIPLPKDFPLQKILPDISQNMPLPPKIELAFSLYQIKTPILQPWPASIPIPKEERDFWLKTDLPFTPQTLNVREYILSFNGGKLPENPEVARLFAENLHEMSLKTENGTPVTKEQASLLWRITSLCTNSQLSTLNSQLLKYQPQGNHEGELFKNLPEPVKRELLQELPKEKTLQPEVLQKAVERVMEKMPEEMRPVLQNLKEQIQWTRVDQDTRAQNDKENIFYFMHEGELQKGRLKVKDERKGGSKSKQESAISFSIETHVKNLGNVHVDLTLSKGILNIKMQDEVGTASDAVSDERETLAKELTDIGISLGELIYGKTPKIKIVKVTEKTEKITSGLDVKA
ncbi:MAG: flagellar hook-length control protein FliK [Fibromonadales bacterium]|nr:flagellar hook-length control protein FliK [Fibromonadales bacterium]